MSEKLSYLWKIIQEAGVIDKTINVVGLALSGVSVIAGMMLGKELPLPWWSGLALGAPMSFGATLWAVVSKAYTLKEAAKPKLIFREVSNTESPSGLHHTNRRFEIEIFNDSTELLSECCVYLDSLVANDGQVIPTAHLPKPLLTREGELRAKGDGQARFRMRPQQRKIIGLFDRLDGHQSEIFFCFEGESEPFWSFMLLHCNDLTATIIAYGAPSPTSVTLHIYLDDKNKTHVERVAPIGDTIGHS